MADQSFLEWPFFAPAHRNLALALDAWAGENLGDIDETNVDAACRELVRRLAEGGWLDHCVPAAFGGASEKLNVQALCLIRETLARHLGLADFAFAMQGLGSGAISPWPEMPGMVGMVESRPRPAVSYQRTYESIAFECPLAARAAFEPLAGRGLTQRVNSFVRRYKRQDALPIRRAHPRDIASGWAFSFQALSPDPRDFAP